MKEKPKVLLYGTNCASVINSLAIGFEQINIPVKALSFDYNRSVYNNYSKIKCICTNNKPGRIEQFLYKIKGLAILLRYLLWCDVVHIYGTKRNFHYWLIARLVKYKFVTFVGAEIRMPKLELALNPFYQFAYNNEKYERKHEIKNNADRLVQTLANLHYGFIMWDMEMFINRNISRKVAIVPHASVNHQKQYLNTDTELKAGIKRPLIIHSPTAPVAKGTEFVLKAIEKLKEKNIDFEFKLLQNIPNDEYQRLMMDADIYVDQFIWGAYGVATQQALQMGKVVVAYLSPRRLAMYSDDVPVQNATIHNLADVLEKLIANAELRKKISENSMIYFQRTHQPDVVAKKMLAAYRTLSEN